MTTESIGRVMDILVEDEVKESYLTYAMSVIVSRALPDVRDGLKPSQRRILVAMNDLNLGPTAKHRKCAKVAGDTSGNYHPHGEAVVYPTLVRMAQSWNMRYPLVDGQGNFGSIDGDPPAAMRYTEARMARPAMDLLADLEENTVDLTRNYDDQRDEPTVLPGKFPNLLANGASGIAVGMATSMAPHNIVELCAAIHAVLDDPAISVRDLMRHLPGPDFPTGGIICGRQGILEAYTTGRGRITLRAKVHHEEFRQDRSAIVVDEIPYQVNKSQLIETIADHVNGGRITGISQLRDESDKDGMRIVIELKRGEDWNVVLNQLYKHTQLQDTFSMIMIALVEGRPRTLSIKELIECYRDHRMDVIRRRTQYLLDKALARAHIVEGLIKALDWIDEIIAVIKASPDVPAARLALQHRFEFSEIQSDHIVKMALGRLTGLERKKLEDELAELQTRIADYRDILAREERVIQIIRDDLAAMKDKYGDERRTAFTEDDTILDTGALITEETVVVSITKDGYAKRLPLSTYRAQGRGGRGVMGGDMKEGDFVEHLFVSSTHDYLLIFTDHGKVYWLKVYDIPLYGRQARGRPMINLIQIAPEERITSLVPVRHFDERFLVMATRMGYIKRTALAEFGRPRPSGLIACTLEEGDRLVRVVLTSGEQDLLLGTRDAKSARFSETDVRQMGRSARGNIAMKLRGDDALVDMVVVDDTASLLIACANGYGKRTDFSEWRTTSRNVQGVRLIGNPERNGPVVSMMAVHDDDQVVLMTREGQVVRTSVESISRQGRDAGGVILIRLQEDDRLVAIAKVAKEDQNEDEEPENPIGDAEETETE